MITKVINDDNMQVSRKSVIVAVTFIMMKIVMANMPFGKEYYKKRI